MKPDPRLSLDPRRAEAIAQAFLTRRPGFLPGWQPALRGADSALVWIFARYLETIFTRLNGAPNKDGLALLETLGIDLIPAQSARAPLVFRMSKNASNTFVEAGTQVVAPPPPEIDQRIVFETERRAGLSPAHLDQVFSLWPGRDGYIDHSDAVQAGQPFQLFNQRNMVDIPHHLYLAHKTLLALSGKATVKLLFEMLQGGSQALSLAWEYWDGKVWRPFSTQRPECLDVGQPGADSTQGLQYSGQVTLQSDCADAQTTTINGVESYWIRGVLQQPLPPDPSLTLPLVDSVKIATEIDQLDPSLVQNSVQQSLQLQSGSDPQNGLAKLFQSVAGSADAVSWLQPDQALFGVLKLDTTQTFYPLGQAPKPGDVFYFSSQEVFSKPGAVVYVQVEMAETPSSKFKVDSFTNGQPATQDHLTPDVQWEYWNGQRWKELSVTTLSSTDAGEHPQNFQTSGIFRFTVPDDLSKVKVNNQAALWVRAYLKNEGYGLLATVEWSEGVPNKTNKYTYVVYQPPAVAKFRMGYTWQLGPYPPQHVFTYNDFNYEDQTDADLWPGQGFAPFERTTDSTPALYLGFDHTLPIERLNLFVDIQEDPNDWQGPALVWEYWDGFNWQRVQAEDETNHLRVPGMVSWIEQDDHQELARFGKPRYFLRGRLKEDGPPGSPTLNAIYPNAVWASQRQTVVNEPLGVSTGQPDQVFLFRESPILPGEVIEVQELSGLRANVEWRMLALELLGDDYRNIQDIEDELRREDTQADIQRGDLRLRRDRHKGVAEAWVHWKPRVTLFGAGEKERCYLLAHSTGRLIFGDGLEGRVPPLGAPIQAMRFTTGGGTAGNAAAGSINQMQGGVAGVEQVQNPIPAGGGADGESLPALIQRGPLTLRHGGRALAAADYETMAREASPAVSLAHALADRDPAGIQRPGWITLIVLPNSNDPRPWPSFGLRETVRAYITARAPATLEGIYVTGPQYQPVDVSARIVPLDPAAAGAVEQAARHALLAFFQPLRGGPDRMGWLPGSPVYLSDVAALLERVDGVDFVTELSLTVDSVLQGEQAQIPAGRLAVAGDLTIQITEQ